jgi:ComF family protein
MQLLTDIKEATLHLLFPHVCEGCGSDVLQKEHELCLRCLSSLPQTNFHLHTNNPIERLFIGRIPLMVATAQFYFTKESLMQRLMHSFKYKSNKELGLYLGNLMGQALTASNRFNSIEALVPLPLFPSKEKRRGYNQATILCQGIAQVIGKPVLKNAISRNQHTETQTKKNRVERWQNMEGRFELKDAASIEDKHILLVDDVVTTGATLEACARELLQAQNTQLSIATLCFSSGN